MGRRRGSSATDAAAVPRAPPPTAAVMNELASSTHFSAPELLSLSQRFADLDGDGDGLVDADEVCAMGEVAMYPLSLTLTLTLTLTGVRDRRGRDVPAAASHRLPVQRGQVGRTPLWRILPRSLHALRQGEDTG